jgi:glycosyltransferase involved in cell wall biosynthesis
MPAISIIMPCYNHDFDLARILARYDEQDTIESFEVIAIDDGSRDRTYPVLCDYRPQRYRLQVVRQERNQGPAAARNRGIQLAQAPVVAFVGDDILPEPDFVRGHLDAHRRLARPEMAVLGQTVWAKDLPVNSLMAYIDGEGAQQFSYFYLRDGQEYDFRHLYTSNISLKRELLLAEGRWFDTDFPFAAMEDAELGYRLSKRGLRIVYHAGIRGYHYHYHTIWSFSTRQFVSGISSRTLVKKHPQLRFHPSFRGHYRRLVAMLSRTLRSGARISAAQAAGMERLACHYASTYEWQNESDIYKLYAPLLEYFFYSGVLKAALGERAFERWGHGAHAQAYLIPALRQFTGFALVKSIPLPAGIDERTF